ncbi:calcium/proton exchanger [Dendrothele bispora CBS 962.96]|uniref:Vacuolar calcium ion transporter n=1 Tax=Dendrothele bispora (strain CBS 962.96) TaxID=1314807 RepID=A0A4S8MWL4_DENBC|nr:calcium/proton exchanger [Dendrothele bispora CBS 962.96]
MNEPPPSTTNNVSNSSLPQSTLPTGLPEDEDEPPSSNGTSTVEKPQLQSQPDSEMKAREEMKEENVDSNPESNVAPPALLQPKVFERQLPRRQITGTSCRSRRPSRFQRLKALVTPNKPVGPTPTYRESIKAAIRYTPLNVCLLFIPVSWALHFTQQSDTLTFVFSALGIVPLAAMLGFGTEQIALRTSSSIGGLLNATLGNIVEMIIAGIALNRCELDLVQSSLLGGLLSNLLFVLGMAFVVGGYRFHQQEFQPMVAQLNSSLMTVAVIALIVPAAFHEYLGDRLPQGAELSVLLELSRGSSIILILIYIAFLFFQFYSHKSLFLDVSQPSLISSASSLSTRSSRIEDEEEGLPRVSTVSSIPSVSSASTIESPKLNSPVALFLLVASTALAYVTAENLVSSLEGVVESHPEVSKEWLTLIIIPIISNAAEHCTAVVVAHKGKFDLAMSVAVGSCIQIALFVIPLLVLVAWGMDKPLTLYFDELETLVLFFSVILVKFSIEDGKSHWMSGIALIAVYALIALSFWNFPVTIRTLQGEPLTCS